MATALLSPLRRQSDPVGEQLGSRVRQPHPDRVAGAHGAPRTEGCGDALAGPILRGADQVSQGFLRSAPQFAPQEQLDESAPPPGREVEVSIESNERASLGFGQGDVFMVLDAERQAHEKVDRTALWVDVPDFDVDGPAPAKGWRGEVDGLAFLDRPRRFGTHIGCVGPFPESFGRRQDAPDPVG